MHIRHLAGSGDTAKSRHHIGVNYQHQTPAASCVEKHVPNIIFDEWVGTNESRFERNRKKKIIKHPPQIFKGQSATLSIEGCFADCS